MTTDAHDLINTMLLVLHVGVFSFGCGSCFFCEKCDGKLSIEVREDDV